MFLMYLQKIHEVFILFLRSFKYTYREEIKYREMWKVYLTLLTTVVNQFCLYNGMSFFPETKFTEKILL